MNQFDPYPCIIDTSVLLPASCFLLPASCFLLPRLKNPEIFLVGTVGAKILNKTYLVCFI